MPRGPAPGRPAGRAGRARRALPALAISLALLAGVCLLLYPTASQWWNSMHQSRAVAGYAEAVSGLDEGLYEELLSEARAYNEALASLGSSRWTMTEEEYAEYESLLSVPGTDAIGYIEIPSIGVYLPIYHGTGSAALQAGAGHLEGSSLPVGGEGTHTVISGHRGLPSARLFTDLDELGEGDVFVLHVLGEELAYEVDQVLVVEPDDLSALAIEEGLDLCTLVTCTPYGINTHRLLVRGHRVELSSVSVESAASLVGPGAVAALAAGAAGASGLAAALAGSLRKSRRFART